MQYSFRVKHIICCCNGFHNLFWQSMSCEPKHNAFQIQLNIIKVGARGDIKNARTYTHRLCKRVFIKNCLLKNVFIKKRVNRH